MKSPQDMGGIQIDITNACIHKCSNCTRFCGHHKKPFFMDFETFKKAVDSFEGYYGTVGIIGGEPTLHPEFERFLSYLQEHPYFEKNESLLLKPTLNVMNSVAQMEQEHKITTTRNGITRRHVLGYGLWSALCDKYREHYEQIQDTFNFQALNDHTNIMYHSPILIRRKDLKINDEKWLEMRNHCWAQENWSATITPKGAFFCEVAGALDMLLDGPGGWPIEPGWWKRTPDQFGDQLKWCELCGIAMETFTRDANEEIDDMSQWWYDTLKELGSPKVRAGMSNVLDISEDGVISEESKRGVKEIRQNHYFESYFSRFGEKNDWLNPKGFVGVLIGNDFEKKEEYIDCLKRNQNHIDRVYFSTWNRELYHVVHQEIEDLENVFVLYAEKTTWGSCVNKMHEVLKNGEYIILFDTTTRLKENATSFLHQYVLNPGCILLKNEAYDMEGILGKDVLAIFSLAANALKEASFPVISQVNDLQTYVEKWEVHKRIPLTMYNFQSTEYTIEPTVKYAIYGLGHIAHKILPQFNKTNIVFACDSNPDLWGTEFEGIKVISPSELYKNRESFEKIFVTCNAFPEVKKALLEMGFAEADIVTNLLTF